MTRKTTIRRGIYAAVCLGAVLMLISIWRMQSGIRQAERAYEVMKSQIETKQYGKALRVIDAYRPPYNWNDGAMKPEIARWAPPEIEVVNALGMEARLLWLYEHFPSDFEANENASLTVARTLLQKREIESVNDLRAKWKGKETLREDWRLCDIDMLLQAGRRDSALALLTNARFTGPRECDRLIRLALLHAARPDEAWKYLGKALEADPRNPMVRSFRGQLLEAMGKLSDAQAEYWAACYEAPSIPLYRDQLGEFYLRHEKFAHALETWAQGLGGSAFPFLGVKVWFWSKLVSPAKVDLKKTDFIQDSMFPFLEYLLSLSADEYWDEAKFQELPDALRLENERQEIFWLRLIQLLRRHQEQEALKTLELNRFSEYSWRPQLESSLKWILRYRQAHVLGVRMIHWRDPGAGSWNRGKTLHPFFEMMQSLMEYETHLADIPAAYKRILESDDVFSAAFLAAGFIEAALNLRNIETYPADFPGWFAFGFAQALRYNRGPAQAREFIAKQEASSALTLLNGELMLEEGDAEGAIAMLEPLRTDNSPTGYRAAWLLAMYHLGGNAPDMAEQCVMMNELLAKSSVGQELLAKISLGRGDTEAAARYYTDIVESSLEAKSFLARKAFREERWKQASLFTEELLGALPGNRQLLENMQIINEAAGPRK